MLFWQRHKNHPKINASLAYHPVASPLSPLCICIYSTFGILGGCGQVIKAEDDGLIEMSWSAVLPLPRVSFLPPNPNVGVGLSNPSKTFSLCVSDRSPSCRRLLSHPHPHPHKLLPSRHPRKELPINTIGRCSSTSQAGSSSADGEDDDAFSQPSQDVNVSETLDSSFSHLSIEIFMFSYASWQ